MTLFMTMFVTIFRRPSRASRYLPAIVASLLSVPLHGVELTADMVAAWERHVVLAEGRLEAGPSPLNTTHRVKTERTDRLKLRRVSRSIRIAEVESAGTSEEHEKPVGHDRGFLWKLNSYWTYEEFGDGQLVTWESISLSRSVPAALRWFVQPLVERASRQAMVDTLESTSARFRPGQATSDRQSVYAQQSGPVATEVAR